MSKATSKTLKVIAPIKFDELVNVEINKPGRYLGHELGVKERNWNCKDVRWALTYPEPYEVGASNLGHIILYSILNQVPGQVCDRAYLPANDLANRLKERTIPLFGVESRLPLNAFDVLGFSLSYELSATNILEMLNLSQIPIYAKDRKNIPLDNYNSHPLVFAGGPTATSNPEPYADFFDFFALGDGEELLPEIGLIVAEAKKQSLQRSSLLRELSEIPGVYVPSLYEIKTNYFSVAPLNPSIPKKIIRRVATPIPFYATGLVPNIETVHDRLTIEIRRGCTRGCRFCQPGMLTRPARDVDPKEVIDAVEQGMKKTGYSDFSLLSLSCSDYLSLPAVGVEIKNRLSEKNITLQLPSQRIDRFDDDIAHILGGGRKAGLTFAPEAGTQRLRDIVNKGLTDADLLKGVKKAMEKGYKKVKLYFMIGLPGESDIDVIGIAKTSQWLQEECKSLGRLNLNITISNFTPKPHTPFQWHSVSSKEFIRRQELLKKEFRSLKGIKLNMTDVRMSAIEDFLGRGDRRLSSVIKAAWEAGAGMDAWHESQDRAYEAWSTAISDSGLDQELRKLEIGNWGITESLKKEDLITFCSKPLPWDHIDTGITKEWLIKDLQLALKGIEIDDCSFGSCSSCGVCGPELGHNQIQIPPDTPIQKEITPPPGERKCRIRFCFTKTYPLHLLSHLDLMRLLERAIRRSNLPVSYSEGFHPLPRIQIALALPLGVESFGEFMDIDFYQKIDAKIVQEKLQKELPNGMQILDAETIPVAKNSLSQSLKEARWTFSIKAFANRSINLFQLKKAINNIIEAEELVWTDIDKKGRKRSRDFKPELKSLTIRTKLKQGNQISSVKILEIELHSLISFQGKSIKPIHIKYWLSKHIGNDLEIFDLKRTKLILKRC